MNKHFLYIKQNKTTFLLRSLIPALATIVIITLVLLLKKPEKPSYRPWHEIKQSGNLKVGILYNYTDYYILHGAIYGFHYELTKQIANDYDLNIEYEVYNSYADYCFALLHHKIDVLVMDISRNLITERLFDLSIPHSYSQLVLVQNKNKTYLNSRDSTLSTKKSKYQIAIPSHTTYLSPALHIQKQYGRAISINTVPLTVEELLEEINNGVLDFTIVNYKSAHANSIFYKNIDYKYTVSKSKPLYWAVAKGNDSLLFYLNSSLKALKNTKSYTLLLQKYYNPVSSTRSKLKHKSRITPLGDISPYDDIIEKYANKYGIDWLLVSSLIYQESKFHAHTSGGGGAYGLMQFMPGTADYWGVNIGDSPEKQIKAGCKYIKYLQTKYYDSGVKDTNELLKFVLAAYNAGSCRVDDARILAKDLGYNENIWDKEVEISLLLLSDRKMIKNSKLKCGRYTRSKHTIKYVNDIIYRYYHYKNLNKQLSSVDQD